VDLSPTWGVNPLAGHMGGRLYFVTQSQLRRANTVRLYLRVITLADLCDPTGNYIPSSMLNGDWQAGSDLLWPFQPQPPKSYFATFRRLIRLSFSRNTPVHHHYLDSLNLDTPLGKWLPVPRNTWFPVYRAQDELYWRQKDDDTLFVLVKSPTSGFFHFSHTTTTLPLDCHPITYQQIGHSLWTQRKYRPHVPTARVPPPPGHIVSNTLSDPTTEVLTVGCDGSVYLKDEVAACAWMIAESTDISLTACFLLTDISSISSYRSELEGIYRSLMHVSHLGLTHTQIQQWCDNESAVNDSNTPLYTPSSMVKPDADILLAIHHLKSQLEAHCSVSCRHIYGHQDTKRRDTPALFCEPNTLDSHSDTVDDEFQSLRLHESLWETQSWSSPEATWNQATPSLPHNTPPLPLPLPLPHLQLPPHQPPTPQPQSPPPSAATIVPPGTRIEKTQPLSVTVNIECDRIASETAKLAVDGDANANLPPVLLPPYRGSRAMLRIGHKWITSHTKSHILPARWTEPVIMYCIEKYGWTRETFNDISWRSIKTARNKCTATQLTQTSKIMHDLLPTMHMLAHMSGSTQCPSCTHPDETLDHIFHCPHPLLQRNRELILEQLRKKGLKLRIPYPVVSAWCALLSAYFDDRLTLPQFSSLEISAAAQAQQVIGLKFMPRGFLSTKWIEAMDTHGCTHSTRKLAAIVHFMWIQVTDTHWRVRNDIVHNTQNLNDLAQEGLVDDQLRWYLSNYRTALSRHDYKLMGRITMESLELTPLRTKRQWIRHLDTARKAFDAEKLMLEPGQQLLTRYFTLRG